MFVEAMLYSGTNVEGKTISVNMFVEAMLYSVPNVETWKRISQKLLSNMQKFFSVICNDDVTSSGFSITHINMEEMVLKGSVSIHDVRVVNSYPRKILSPTQSPKVCRPKVCRPQRDQVQWIKEVRYDFMLTGVRLF